MCVELYTLSLMCASTVATIDQKRCSPAVNLAVQMNTKS